MPEDQLHIRLRTYACFRDAERRKDLGEIVIRWGKYAGKRIEDIPLRYLDETVSVTPPTWFVRRVREFVDLALHTCIVWDTACGDVMESRLPAVSFGELERRRDEFLGYDVSDTEAVSGQG